jgi:ribosome maturation factor RimP
MKFIPKNIIQEIEKIVQKHNFFLIDLIERGNVNNPVFEFYIDGTEIVTIENCAQISREIRNLLETESSVSEKYRIDVSSPGVDRPLKFIEQYHKHIGRKFELKFKLENQTKKITVDLVSILDNKLNFKNANEDYLIDFDTIMSAKVLITF